MGFLKSNSQYWMGQPDPSSKGWKACSKLVIDKTGLDNLLSNNGAKGWTIFQQFPSHNESLYIWNDLYDRWDPIN